MHARALETQRRMLGDMHPDVARTYSHLGQAHEAKGDLDRAMECHSDALKIRELKLGLEHADTAYTLGRLGGIYRRKANYRKAMEYLHLSLAICEKVLGPVHLGTAIAAHNLGGALQRSGEPEMAEVHFLRAVEVLQQQEENTGKNHPFLQYATESLDRCRQAMGQAL